MNPLIDLLFSGPEPDHDVLQFADGSGLSRAALFDRTGQIANALTGAGVAPGDRVAAQVEKSAEAIALYLGCVRAGAVFMPLNTAYPPAELTYFLGDAAPSVFVCDPAMAAAAEGLAGEARILTLDAQGQGSLTEAAAGAGSAFDTVARAEDDMAALLYTSGTTGRSKGAMLTQGNLASNARVLIEAWGVTAADRLVHILPVFHTHGLFVAVNTLLGAGGAILFRQGFDAGAVVKDLSGATMLMGVPTHYTRLLGEPSLTAAAAAGMRLFISGSAPLLAETHAAFTDRTGHRILERYGMTECGMALSNPLEGERRAGTVGRPLGQVSARIVDAEGAEVSAGTVGMLELRGPNVFQGYWRQPDKTAETFRDGWLVTGDLARHDEAGYVEIVGRDKDLVITGGLNVYPKEVETAIDALPGVVESAVIGLPHADFGEAVTAVVVTEPGVHLTEEDIQAALANALARFKQPKRVLFAATLPRNAMGKVQKAELRRDHGGLYAPAPVAATAATDPPGW